MKRLLKIAASILILIAVICAGGIFYISRGLEEGQNLALNGVDPPSLSDGTYHGIYDGGRWSNEVNVTITNQQISEIEVVKDVRFPKPEVTGELISRVIQEQTTAIDAVSGSTVTCKAYLKSIENALNR